MKERINQCFVVLCIEVFEFFNNNPKMALLHGQDSGEVYIIYFQIPEMSASLAEIREFITIQLNYLVQATPIMAAASLFPHV